MAVYNFTGCNITDWVAPNEITIENVFGIITVIICLVGITFNTLNVVITCHHPLKGSLHGYLMVLSIVDALFLICVIPMRSFRCGDGCSHPPTLSAKIYEKFVFIPGSNILAVIDIMVTTTWSIHRVLYVLRLRSVTDSRRVPAAAVIISTIMSIALHIPFYMRWTIVNGQEKRSDFFQSKTDLYYTTALIIGTRAIPIVTLCVTNALLLKSVNDAIKRRAALASQRLNVSQLKSLYHQTRVTIILVAVICLMIIGNTPIVLAQTQFAEKLFNIEERCLQYSLQYRTFRAFANIIEQLAFSLNFLIYYAMNKTFRTFVQKNLRCKKNNEVSAETT